MPAWNENHYARADEFLRTIAEAAALPAPAGTAPRPAVPASPRPAAEAAPAPATGGQSAASVFTNIPWKR